MKIRKFFAGTCRDALRQIREDIGPDAVVLSNRSVANGVEIVALAEEDLDALAGGDMPTHRPRPRPAVPVAPVAAVTGAPIAAAHDAGATSAFAQTMMDELQSMRGLLEEQVAGLVWNDKQRRSRRRARFCARCSPQGSRRNWVGRCSNICRRAAIWRVGWHG